MTDWSALETPLYQEPAFPVQAPDQRRDWTEIQRQATLFTVMRFSAPRVLGFAIPNAGKRNPAKARKEGIRGGAFDTIWHWKELTAYVEMKGFDKRGRPGKLSDAQIEFGNCLVTLGIPCACFFCPYDAADWLRSVGFPVSEIRRAA